MLFSDVWPSKVTISAQLCCVFLTICKQNNKINSLDFWFKSSLVPLAIFTLEKDIPSRHTYIYQTYILKLPSRSLSGPGLSEDVSKPKRKARLKAKMTCTGVFFPQTIQETFFAQTKTRPTKIEQLQMSNENNPGCWCFIFEDFTTQLHWDYLINHDRRIPSKQPVFHGK